MTYKHLKKNAYNPKVATKSAPALSCYYQKTCLVHGSYNLSSLDL